MSNVIYIQGQSSGAGAMKNPNKVMPIVDSELTINYETEFGSFNDLVPGIGNVLDLVRNVSTGMSGQIGSGLLNLSNMMAVSRWQNTKPARVNVKLHFYTKTNPKTDVVDEMQDLINLYILTPDGNGGYYVPGISLKTMKMATDAGAKGKDMDLKQNGKFCAIKIPGMIFLAACMVTQAQSTYSNERTESGCPLWGILDIEFTGLYPATPDTYDKFPSMENVGGQNINLAQERIG